MEGGGRLGLTMHPAQHGRIKVAAAGAVQHRARDVLVVPRAWGCVAGRAEPLEHLVVPLLGGGFAQVRFARGSGVPGLTVPWARRRALRVAEPLEEGQVAQPGGGCAGALVPWAANLVQPVQHGEGALGRRAGGGGAGVRVDINAVSVHPLQGLEVPAARGRICVVAVELAG